MGFIKNEMATDDMFLHVYGDLSKENFDQRVNQLLESQGYKFIGQEQDGCLSYERGNRTMRLLLGAFIKYSKVSVRAAETAPNEIKCEVRSQSSGMSGGLIGVNQVKNEMRNLFSAFQSI